MRRLPLRVVLIAITVVVSLPVTLTHAAQKKINPNRPTAVVYEGALDLEGHYARPGDTRRFRSVQLARSDGRGGALLDWWTWPEGDSAGAPES